MFDFGQLSLKHIFALLFLFPVQAFTTTLLIWVSDQKVAPGPELTDANFVYFKKLLSERMQDPVVSVKMEPNPNTNWKTFEAALIRKLNRNLSGKPSITHIILVDHGGNSRGNIIFNRLGGMTPWRPFGPLRTVIRAIGPKLSPELHVTLGTCEAFNVEHPGAQLLAQGLYKEVSQFGVTSLSIWGSEDALKNVGCGFKHDRLGQAIDLGSFLLSSAAGVALGSVFISHQLPGMAVYESLPIFLTSTLTAYLLFFRSGQSQLPRGVFVKVQNGRVVEEIPTPVDSDLAVLGCSNKLR